MKTNRDRFMKSLFKLSGLLAAALMSQTIWAAEVVVIGNKTNHSVVDKAFVVKVFTGEAKYWPGGGVVVSIDQADDSPVRAEFYTRVVGRSATNMKALRAQNVFTGNALPPKVLEDDVAVKKLVAGNKNAIGYINPSSVDDTIIVLVK